MEIQLRMEASRNSVGTKEREMSVVSEQQANNFHQVQKMRCLPVFRERAQSYHV